MTSFKDFQHEKRILEVEKLRNHYTAKTILRQTKGVMTEAQEAFVAEHFNPSIKD